MKELLSTNCFDTEESIVILGSCLRDKENLKEEIPKISPYVYTVCLEETHFNMVVTKVLDILAREKTKRIAIITVDKSPHCTQLHYLTKEIENILGRNRATIQNYVVENDKLVEIPLEIIGLSKNLAKLKREMKGE